MTNKILSFFTGAGLLDIGFNSAGFDCVWHNEFNPRFLMGFKHGMHSLYGKTEVDLNFYLGSIADLSVSDIKKQTPQGLIESGDFGVIGGPPCPDFSNGGKHKGHEGEHGKLTGIYVDVILSLKPKFFLLENVKGLVYQGKHKAYLLEQVRKLSNYYYFDISIINALELGVPQDRERVIVVGFRKNFIKGCKDHAFCRHIQEKNNALLMEGISISTLSKFHWFDWPRSEQFVGARFLPEWPEPNNYGEVPEVPVGLPGELMVGNMVFNDSIVDLPNQDDVFRAFSDKFWHIREGDVSRKSFKRLHRWRYSPTAAYGNNEVHLHPWLPRRLSVREVMRIQSVPDSYVLPCEMSLTDKFKTISNGVPVVLAQRVAEKIAEFIA